MEGWLKVKETGRVKGFLNVQVLFILLPHIHFNANIRVTLLLFILVTIKVRLIIWDSVQEWAK